MVWGCRCEWVNGEGHGCQWRARWFGDAGVNGLMVKAMVASGGLGVLGMQV